MTKADNKNHKVLFVSHSGLAYGAERSLLALVSELSSNSDITPIVLVPSKGFLSEQLEKQNVDVVIFPLYNWITDLKLYPFNLFGFLLNYLLVIQCKAKFKSKNIDLVYSNSLATNFGALLAKKMNKKHIWHIREFVQEDLNRFFIPNDSYVTKFVGQTTQHIIYNSQIVANKFTQIFKHTKSTVVYNGFDFEEELQSKNRYQQMVATAQPIKLIIIGAIRHEKGQHDAIKCLIELRKRNINVELNIVGKGKTDYIATLQKFCVDESVTEYVNFVGTVEKPLDYFRGSAMSLAASSNEAFGRIVVESSSVGCPTVASNSGGLPEIIQHGKTGLLYQKHDIHDMANKVQQLLSDEKKYNAVSQNAMQDVRHRFALKQYVKEINQTINFVINP